MSRSHPRGAGLMAVAVILGAVIAPACSPTAHARSRRGRGHPAPGIIKTFPPHSKATVLNVIDADSAWFKVLGLGRFKGRFYGINAPECHKKQVRRQRLRSARCVRDDEHFGLGAYEQAVRLLRGRQVTLGCPRKPNGACRTGGFGRILVTIDVGRVDVLAALVRDGAAWAFTKYASTNRDELCRLEARAQRLRVGMWRIGRAEVVRRMHPNTRRWYQRHDQRCARARDYRDLHHHPRTRHR